MSETNGLTKTDLTDALKAMQEDTAALIAGEVGSLHSQIRQSEARLGAKLDEINARLDIHGRSLLTGARQIAGLIRFTEKSGEYWRALAKRVDALEQKNETGDGKA
jgi:hypothetical protein